MRFFRDSWMVEVKGIKTLSALVLLAGLSSRTRRSSWRKPLGGDNGDGAPRDRPRSAFDRPSFCRPRRLLDSTAQAPHQHTRSHTLSAVEDHSLPRSINQPTPFSDSSPSVGLSRPFAHGRPRRQSHAQLRPERLQNRRRPQRRSAWPSRELPHLSSRRRRHLLPLHRRDSARGPVSRVGMEGQGAPRSRGEDGRGRGESMAERRAAQGVRGAQAVYGGGPADDEGHERYRTSVLAE